MSGKANEDNKELVDIPRVCQYKILQSAGNEKLLNENPDWLKDQGPIPVWSPLKSLSRTGPPSELRKCEENNFTVEIPERLASLFGSASLQTECIHKMQTLNNFHLMSNVFALCTALRNDFNNWSPQLIDTISTAVTAQYRDFLKEHSITDQEMDISRLSASLNFNGDAYKVRIHQVATGILYLPFGVNKFNLARALTWFFNRYQFGCIKCGHRTLAIGKILNNELDFFMYDCQSSGYPMFAEQQNNSYILKTPYLRILHYCLLKTLNFAVKVNFVMYNVDVTIINPSESTVFEKNISPLVLNNSAKDVFAKKAVLCTGAQKKTQKPKQKYAPKSVQKRVTNRYPVCHKPSGQNSLSQSLSSHENNRKIVLDPKKMYYIIAVPKTNLVTAKVESKHLIIPKVGLAFDNKSENDQINREHIKEFEVEKLLESINLQKSASTVTLIPETVETKLITNPETLGFKVYLVENNDHQDLREANSVDQIKIAHQLKDFFVK